MVSVTNINEVLEGHVALELDCVDRLYLNAYVPRLQVGGQVVQFLTGHLGKPVPSPALFAQIGNRFRREVRAFAAAHGIPVLHLKKPDRRRWDDRKLDHVRPHLERAEREGRFGVVAIVAAQEFQWVFGARNRSDKPGVANFAFEKGERRVSVYYFYVHDREFGPGFIKLCTYFPYPAKVWLNGHEWAKRQAERAGIPFTALSNGFASCAQPRRLQALCDRFGPRDVQAFFDRWLAVIPTPLGEADRAGGYWWELSMRQVEVSRTLVFDDPRRARLLRGARHRQHRHRPPRGDGGRLRPPGAEDDPRALPHPHLLARQRGQARRRLQALPLKQYLKEGRALRIEAVINKPADLGVLARLQHLPELVAKARQVNNRLLIIERAGQGCAIGSALFERIHQPYVREGQRTGAFRFGDPRAMALAGALCTLLHAVTGFSNKSLRGHVAGLLGHEYTSNQISYDLRRLRLHGLIRRLPRRNTYVLTGEGIRVAVFYSKPRTGYSVPCSLPTGRPPGSRSAAHSPSSSAPSTTTPSAHASELSLRKTCHNLTTLVTKKASPGRG